MGPQARSLNQAHSPATCGRVRDKTIPSGWGVWCGMCCIACSILVGARSIPSHVPLLVCDSFVLAVGSICHCFILGFSKIVFFFFPRQKMGCFASEFIQQRVCMCGYVRLITWDWWCCWLTCNSVNGARGIVFSLPWFCIVSAFPYFPCCCIFPAYSRIHFYAFLLFFSGCEWEHVFFFGFLYLTMAAVACLILLCVPVTVLVCAYVCVCAQQKSVCMRVCVSLYCWTCQETKRYQGSLQRNVDRLWI